MHNAVDNSDDRWIRAPMGGHDVERAGSQALSIFSYALNARLIRGHADGPLNSANVEETIGWAPHTSLRTAISNLCDGGVLERSDQDDGSRGTVTELTDAGRGLLEVADHVEGWLGKAPGGPIELDTPAATGAIRALTAGWDSGLVRMLAEEELSLTELSTAISGFSYPTLERRLSRMRSTNLVVPVEERRRGKPYAVTPWLRQALAPLCIAGRWERVHRPEETQPVGEVEVEAAFLLALPMVQLPATASGTCSLAVLTSTGEVGEERQVAGVTLTMREGRVEGFAPSTDSTAQSWGLGTAMDWLNAVIDGSIGAVRVGGAATDIPHRIARDIHRALFPR